MLACVAFWLPQRPKAPGVLGRFRSRAAMTMASVHWRMAPSSCTRWRRRGCSLAALAPRTPGLRIGPTRAMGSGCIVLRIYPRRSWRLAPVDASPPLHGAPQRGQTFGSIKGAASTHYSRPTQRTTASAHPDGLAGHARPRRSCLATRRPQARVQQQPLALACASLALLTP